jgi:hypothetical protein
MRRFRTSSFVGLVALALPLRVAEAKPEPKTAAAPSRPASGVAPGAGPGTAGAAGAPTPAPAPGSPNDAPLPPEAALARATAFYEAGQYASCAEAFATLLDDPAQSSVLAPRVREQASVYRAACLIAQGKSAAADDVFRASIRENPQMAVPSAIVFPPAVIERFIVVRTTLLEEIRRAEEERAFKEREAAYQARRRAEEERARVAHLELLASQETLVVKNRRWIASVPFGVGQFQNRDYGWGAVFLTTETLLLATAITSVSIELSLTSQATSGTGFSSQSEVDRLNKNIRTAHYVSLYSTAALLVVALGGVLQSNLAYVPEFYDGVRQRPKKKSDEARFFPVVGPSEHGASIGVVGAF